MLHVCMSGDMACIVQPHSSKHTASCKRETTPIAEDVGPGCRKSYLGTGCNDRLAAERALASRVANFFLFLWSGEARQHDDTSEADANTWEKTTRYGRLVCDWSAETAIQFDPLHLCCNQVESLLQGGREIRGGESFSWR
jgi:hypothetical protein